MSATGPAAMPTTMAANGPPPAAAATLVVGTVMHARLKPRAHRFAYRVFQVVLDLDRLDEAARASRLFSVDRANLVAFRRRDHGRRDGSDPRAHADRLLAAAGLAERPARMLLLCGPRVLGTLFNPLSVYFAYDAGDRLVGVVYEVRNTFGGIHAYAHPVRPGEAGPAGVRQTAAKRFEVSPFIDMEQTYRFHLLPPGRAVRVRILEHDAEGPTLAATFAGLARPFTTAELVRATSRIPLLGAKILAAIHFEALRLWLKGLPLAPRPGRTGASRPETAPRPKTTRTLHP